MVKTGTYVSWYGMKTRCFNKNYKDYKYYGGRGIKVCNSWMKFENFFEDMGERPEGKTLDRIDNNGNYCKENCYWATRKEQANNRRSNRYLTYKGKTQNVSEWAEELNINKNDISNRLNLGWKIERILAG